MKSMSLLNEQKSKCQDMKTICENCISNLQTQESNNIQLFISGRKAFKELTSLQTTLNDVCNKSRVPRYQFRRDPSTEQLLASITAIGRVEKTDSASTSEQQNRQQELKQQQQQQATQTHSTPLKEMTDSASTSEKQNRQQELKQQQQQQATQAHSTPLKEKTDSASTSEKQNRQQELKQQQQQQATQAHSTPLKVPLHGSTDLSQAKFSRQPDISVKTASDNKTCHLTGVARLPGDRLLLTDFNNLSVKLVNTETNTMLSQVKLPDQPWDLCLLPGDRAAVTLPCEWKIQFLSTKGEVSLQDIVAVGGRCYGIDFCDDNLIVSFFYPGKVVLMDMKGKKSVDKDSSSKSLFINSEYLTVTRESHRPSIYVSDWSDTITMLSTSLQVLKTFKDAALTGPRGLTAVGDNQLLVCDNNTIMFLDTSTGKITQLMGNGDGIEKSYSVAYCLLKKWMFVTCYENDFVKVFKVK
ncbi:uncharacterized protein LOC128216305 [Mya arenaria]|uniref:uncharacterized protein LOC128216305 n=1 Tax=Mya arenaria TaxID=6604 RepID=UPI0022E01AF5|nr:uncharacterized protein LOC128216305 [Mya arenaria]